MFKQWIHSAHSISRVALSNTPLCAAELLSSARANTGLHDFGAEPIEDALDQLQTAVHEEADLNLFGRVSTHWDNLRLLTNLLILRDRELADPTILQRPVTQPIFVLGMPRSGSSFLHSLLAEDGASFTPRCWQAIYPYPDHPAAGRRAGPGKVQRQFDLFHRLAPELRNVHPFDALTPQECTEFTAHSFRSLRFETIYHVPSYKRWVQQAGHVQGYRTHRRFLQHLQGARAVRCVLKCPDHVFAMEALREVYPDARVIFTHRDPLKVLPSVARLTEVLRRPFAKRIDTDAIGHQVSADWANGAQQIVAADKLDLWPEKHVFHVHYKALTAAPLDTIQRIYDHFGLEFTPSFRERLHEHIARKPAGGYGKNVYRFADFGLRPDEERERYRDYIAHFGIDEEVVVQ
ncbi:sulfotransferase family protein [Paraburkholderia rhizosphaerae]|uniref:Sulfotransferase family protein n=1 Tax=Paraburkholderia rhizosphaerae TaxID=480658 RepID=A0A4R8LL91_9BURK|nr:sulfotransferase [Paraburkholderia rhizosphaerae]TDY45357.1 sulfotransferase family protein [Paraburkholderia rhizosphaerae]